ncbi:dfe21af9-f4b4-4e4c-8033-167559d72090 [Thermothielavioides terrestris]|uniref:Dfe21af9-f4b4-4e4c-8033-167559d72090 n=1 Tax=Thermothielavioides terrestris TaxID=2587410 RepID=A0A3S4CZL3_9PEZI|nr:dfe21af9-f4b4-4e4c-8033-167559d72090 [Thermothielavioides terrestris]
MAANAVQKDVAGPPSLTGTSTPPLDTPEAPAPRPEEFVPPDGGVRAWLTVAGGWLCQFCSFGFINALGTFQYVYEKEILPDESSSNISWILTTQLFLMFFLSQPVGLGVDMFGVRAILIPAFAFSVGGLIALSFATQYWQIFLAQSLCFGLGAAGAFIPGLVAAGQYFRRRRAMVLGIVSSGSSCGGVVFPIMLARLFDQIGFRATMRYTALMMGVMLAVAILLVSSPLPPKGLAGRRSLISFATFKKPTYLLFVCGNFLVYWGIFGPFDYLPLFASSTPSTAGLSLYTVAIINAVSIPGRILPNIYSDRVGSSLRTMATCSLAAAVSILVIWLPINYRRSLGGLVVFALVFGFASGAYVSLMTPALIEVAGGHARDLGAVVGTFFAVVALASLTGLPVQGAIMARSAAGAGGGGGADGEEDLMGLIVFCGVVMLAGTGLLAGAFWLAEKGKRRAGEK